MLAVILAAGQGLRLRPHTETTPKTMIKVGGKPIIVHILESLPDSVDRIVVVVGYLKEQITEYLGEAWNGIPIEYIEQAPLNGTGSAIHQIKERVSEPFLVVNGDDLYSKEDLTQLSQHPLAMLVAEATGPAPSSILVDETDGLLGIETNLPADKPILRNTGAYMLDMRFFEQPLHEIIVHNKTEYSLPHTLIDMAQDLTAHVERATFWCPIGTAQELETAEQAVSTKGSQCTAR